MDLSNLKPAKGSVKNKKESAEARVPVAVVLPPVDTKVLSRDPVIKGKAVLKAARCRCSDVFRNLVLKI